MGLDQWLNAYDYDDTEYFEFTYRKINFLRNWMIKNTDLTDESDTDIVDVYIDSDTDNSLVKLLNDCNEVLKNNDKADELLPTLDGFFFGGCDYDKWYFEDVKQVRDDIQAIIDNKDKIAYVTYQDWW